jgi:hypothetical protein
MSAPFDVGVIDTMIGWPPPNMQELYSFNTKQTHDTQSKEEFEFPVEYMFKDVPEKKYKDAVDPLAVTLGEMDHWGIEKGLVVVGGSGSSGHGRDPPVRSAPDPPA